MALKGVGAAMMASALLVCGLSVTPAVAKKKQDVTMCSEIMAMCMKRAGNGHAGICEDMYSQAKNSGSWPATQEPDGTKHDPVPCVSD